MQIIGSNIWGGPTPLLDMVRRDYGIEAETLEEAYTHISVRVTKAILRKGGNR